MAKNWKLLNQEYVEVTENKKKVKKLISETKVLDVGYKGCFVRVTSEKGETLQFLAGLSYDNLK